MIYWCLTLFGINFAYFFEAFLFSFFLLKATVSIRLQMPKWRVQYNIYRKHKFPAFFLYLESAGVQYERAIKRSCQEHLRHIAALLHKVTESFKSSAMWFFFFFFFTTMSHSWYTFLYFFVQDLCPLLISLKTLFKIKYSHTFP